MKKPELLAPGGSFLSAVAALSAGADGVYLGLKDFSARKAAQNFTFEQLRRIRQLAADKDRRMYVTVNTIVRESEMDALEEALALLQALEVDGIIVQDLGVCDLLSQSFPGLPIHASTQMALHNEAGLRVAKELGIRRVILSRELPLSRIKELRDAVPDIELEVFIHGALCYSFSGLCLASWELTGRSGNRGDCAQICRSLFREETGGAYGREGHFFSCRDLFLGREVLKLAAAGIDSLKIEGRMKSPEYVFNVTRLYREIIDQGDALSEKEYDGLSRRAELGFAREKTTGWLHSPHGTALIQKEFPGHRGARLGDVSSLQGRDITLRLEGDLSLRDGVAYFTEGRREPIAFSVSLIRKAGREVHIARTGDVVSFPIPLDAGPVLPTIGQEIRHLSSRSLDLPQPREASFPLYKVPIDLDVSLSSDGALSFLPQGGTPFACTVTIDRAARPRPFAPILAALLAESGDSLFRPGKVTFLNKSGLADDRIFVPPSELKKAKNDYYEFLRHNQPRVGRTTPAAALAPTGDFSPSPLGAQDLEMLAHRERLVPEGMSPVPFVGNDPGILSIEQLPDLAGFRWLPMPPVIAAVKEWSASLERLAQTHPQTRIACGLNNLSHFDIARMLGSTPNVWFFVDFFLYAANRRAVDLAARLAPRLLFAYEWIEDAAATDPSDTEHRSTGRVSTVRIGGDFRPPLFYGFGCFARHVLSNGTCSDTCPKDFQRSLRQGGNPFSVVIRDCVTYVFAAPT